MPEMCTSSYVHPLENFLSFSFFTFGPLPLIFNALHLGKEYVFFQTWTRSKALEELLLVLCSQLLVAWKLPALTPLRRLKGALPEPNLTGFGRFCTPKSNGLLEKCKLFSPAVLYGKSRAGKGITDVSSLLAIELDCSDCGRELQTPQRRVRALKFSYMANKLRLLI